MNTTVLSGRLVAAPQLHKTKSDVAVTNATIAVDEGYGEKKRTFFFDFTCWRKTAELLATFRQGAPITISGTLAQRDYEKDGQKRRTTYVEVQEIEYHDWNYRNQPQQPAQQPQAPQGYAQQAGYPQQVPQGYAPQQMPQNYVPQQQYNAAPAYNGAPQGYPQQAPQGYPQQAPQNYAQQPQMQVPGPNTTFAAPPRYSENDGFVELPGEDLPF